MSRTDVHRPWRVQIHDPHNRHILYRIEGNTAWPDYAYASWRNIGCGCHRCTGQRWRRAANRADRVTWRANARDIAKTAPADRDAIDVPPPRRTL